MDTNKEMKFCQSCGMPLSGEILGTNADGSTTFSFTMPDALTRWKLMMLAYTKDRKTGYKVGVWTKNVADMYEPYLLPQDHALRTDNRYIQLVNSEGNGVQIAMNEHFNFNAYQFSTDNLTKSQFTYQLQPQPDRYTLNLDYATTGVGCSCVYVLDEYRLRPTTFDREIELKVLK